MYPASSRALAALEYLVHVDPATVPSDLVLLTIDVPDTAPRDAVDVAALPARWAATRATPRMPAGASCRAGPSSTIPA